MTTERSAVEPLPASDFEPDPPEASGAMASEPPPFDRWGAEPEVAAEHPAKDSEESTSTVPINRDRAERVMVTTLEPLRAHRIPTFITIRSSPVTIRIRLPRHLGAAWQPRSRRAARVSVEQTGREHTMGLMDDAKDVAEEAGHKMGEAAHDAKERVGDKADEVKADADVRAAEANRDSVEKKNELKDKLRQS